MLLHHTPYLIRLSHKYHGLCDTIQARFTLATRHAMPCACHCSSAHRRKATKSHVTQAISSAYIQSLVTCEVTLGRCGRWVLYLHSRVKALLVEHDADDDEEDDSRDRQPDAHPRAWKVGCNVWG